MISRCDGGRDEGRQGRPGAGEKEEGRRKEEVGQGRQGAREKAADYAICVIRRSSSSLRSMSLPNYHNGLSTLFAY